MDGLTELDKIFEEIENERITYLSNDIQIIYKKPWFNFDFDDLNIFIKILLLFLVILCTPLATVLIFICLILFIFYIVLKQIFKLFNSIVKISLSLFINIKVYTDVYGIKGIKYYIEDKLIDERLF